MGNAAARINGTNRRWFIAFGRRQRRTLVNRPGGAMIEIAEAPSRAGDKATALT